MLKFSTTTYFITGGRDCHSTYTTWVVKKENSTSYHRRSVCYTLMHDTWFGICLVVICHTSTTVYGRWYRQCLVFESRGCPGLLSSSPVRIVLVPGTYYNSTLRKTIRTSTIYRRSHDTDRGVAFCLNASQQPVHASTTPVLGVILFRDILFFKCWFGYDECCAPNYPAPWFPNYYGGPFIMHT